LHWFNVPCWQEAEANHLPYAQFLELLFQDEINVRHQRFISRRQKLADFRELRSLENFDFHFNPGINRAQIYELATGRFVTDRRLAAWIEQNMAASFRGRDRGII
jgi:DNA replication protein DnaC